ncbi:MAG: hypothetical protein O2856_13165 [Planctomycetota bacterium]|nr:hypothetical protein [Planctomycetota bacterium]
MSLDKYQQAWKVEAAQMHITIDTNLLSKEVQQSHEAFRSMIFWRDVREVGTSLVMIPVWFVMGIGMSLPWTWYLTVPALLWVAGFMLLDRRRHLQRPSDPGEPLLFYVKESLAQVEHQIWLLRNVFWWYLLPPSISLMAFFTDVTWRSSDGWLEFSFVIGFFGVFLFLLYGWIYRLNQRAVRDQLEPRRSDLQKLITYLEGESHAEDASEMMDLVSALSGTDGNAGLSPNWARWAENWNRIIPSWREVDIILVPTLVGAYFGFRFPLGDMGPVFFQSVVAAVIPFEIAFFSLWYLSCERHKKQPLTGKGKVRLKAPAIVTIIMITLISVLAFAALFSFVAGTRSRRGPDLKDIKSFVDDDIESHQPATAQGELVTKVGYAKVAPYTGVRWENERPVVRVQDRWSPLVSINDIPVDRIMEFANKEYGKIARKRFAEDLVEVLSKMGHEPGWHVTLGLKTQDGQVEQLTTRMTEENRKLLLK